MAVFSLGSGTNAGNLDSTEKIESYLYRLTEQLRYTFTHLDPEENFDERAKLIYAANQERQASLEVALEGITSRYATKESVSEIKQAVDGISLDYCTSSNVVSKINLGREGIAIQASKINLSGFVSANGTFTIDQHGNMSCTSGTFSGSITGGSIAIGQDEGASVSNFFVDSNGHVHARYLEIDGTTNTGSIGCYALNCVGLNVDGNAHVDYTIDCSTLEAYNVVATYGPWNNSDIRLKENIKRISEDDAVKFINALRPSTFRFIDGGEGGTGLIAQELMQAIEDTGVRYPLVMEKEDGYYAVNYVGLIAPIISALQHLLKGEKK